MSDDKPAPISQDHSTFRDAPASSATGPASDGPSSTALRRPSYVFLVVVTFVNLVADLWSKHWAKNHFESIRVGETRKVVVIEDFMNFIFARNKGGAWGLLQNETESLRRPFFLMVSVAAIVFIVSLYRKLQPGQAALKWGLPLVLGGALGNLIDRIRFGFVVDFVDVYMKWPPWAADAKVSHWPTFNVADVAICIGVGLMAIDMFTSRKAHSKADSKADSKAGESGKEAAAADGQVPASSAAPETGGGGAQDPPGSAAAPALGDDPPAATTADGATEGG